MRITTLRGRVWKVGLTAGAAAVALGTTLLAVPPASAATTGDIAINKNFADPSFIKAGKTYYAYATGGNGKGGGFPYATAPRMSGPSTKHGVSMPEKPAWVAKNREGEYQYWAPSVFRNDQGKYVMYFTANQRKHRFRAMLTAKIGWGRNGPQVR
ncbi:MAG: hypothetical protein ACRDUA_15850 [Micromonosporaceae bacterium]